MTDETDPIHAAFRLAPDAILLVDDDGQYTYCNRTASELLGLGKAEICNYRFGDFSRGAMGLRTSEWWEQLRRRGRLAVRHVLTATDGRQHTVETRARADVAPASHLLIVRPVAGAAADRKPLLSPREREVLALLATGLTTAEAAAELFLSPLTVRTHVRNAMEKLAARSRVQAVALALREGEITV